MQQCYFLKSQTCFKNTKIPVLQQVLPVILIRNRKSYFFSEVIHQGVKYDLAPGVARSQVSLREGVLKAHFYLK